LPPNEVAARPATIVALLGRRGMGETTLSPTFTAMFKVTLAIGPAA
jgi:ABC-type branched-subunit amino acid transport system ATPase component